MENQMAIEKIRNLAAEKLGLPKDKLDMTTNFFTELGADSLKMLGFISALEREFDVEITDEQVMELYSLENVLNIVNS
ncbi:MAG TPA: acyl carrier protein [Bacillota bacterium]|nr:acyl carrier protein [Bacillota bacterium]